MKVKILRNKKILTYSNFIFNIKTFLIANKIIPPYMNYTSKDRKYDEEKICTLLDSSQVLKNPIKPSNKPLVMFVGGAYDDVFKNVLYGIYFKYYNDNSRNQDIGYATWSSTALIPIINAWHKIGQKICLVGYSWGGDTVYKIANRLNNIKIDMLCTIDPVSFKGRNGNLKKPNNVKIWLNTAIDYSKAIQSIENTIARIGKPWGYCHYADNNFILHRINIDNTTYDATHNMAGGLFYNHLYKFVKNFSYS